jgi:hypothetical protein
MVGDSEFKEAPDAATDRPTDRPTDRGLASVMTWTAFQESVKQDTSTRKGTDRGREGERAGYLSDYS